MPPRKAAAKKAPAKKAAAKPAASAKRKRCDSSSDGSAAPPAAKGAKDAPAKKAAPKRKAAAPSSDAASSSEPPPKKKKGAAKAAPAKKAPAKKAPAKKAPAKKAAAKKAAAKRRTDSSDASSSSSSSSSSSVSCVRLERDNYWWEAERAGRTVHVRWGRLDGAHKSANSTDYASEAKARAALEKKAAAKRKAGYDDVIRAVRSPDVSDSEASHDAAAFDPRAEPPAAMQPPGPYTETRRGVLHHLGQMCEAFHDVAWTGGEHPVPKGGVTVTVKRSGTPCRFPCPPKAVESTLVPECRTAGFGDGAATRVDASVRQALCLAPDEYEVAGMDAVLAAVRPAVASALAAAGQCDISLRRDKLNVYREGGHFVPHQDTPQADTLLGTLVLCLPAAFVGGALTVRSKGGPTGQVKSHDYDWADVATTTLNKYDRDDIAGVPKPYICVPLPGDWKEKRRRENLAKLNNDPGADVVQWAAFYSDVVHAVGRVHAGTRVTVTYAVHSVAPRVPRALRERQVPRVQAMAAYVAGLLADATFLPHGGYLGVPCAYLYPENKDRGAYRPATAGGCRGLKGRDALAALALSYAGLRVRNANVVRETIADDKWLVRRAPPTASTDELRGLFQVQIIEDSFKASGCGYDDVPKAFGDSVTVDPDRIEWVTSVSEQAQQFADLYLSCTGYFGNESSQTCLYMASAVVAVVPNAVSRHLMTAAELKAAASARTSWRSTASRKGDAAFAKRSSKRRNVRPDALDGYDEPATGDAAEQRARDLAVRCGRLKMKEKNLPRSQTRWGGGYGGGGFSDDEYDSYEDGSDFPYSDSDKCTVM
eukprot:TRINITY_DN1694_c0_g3_i2.p1 TRINITY_DN1694_c0_g3~~TRINITY_DN1694_c0_g3_i2.p1  ORF type:complete len:822 (+),score=250.07 TRINITY_DN1694_c0_g3_i2:88-2553(+)